MNRIFKTIWSYRLNRSVVTDERSHSGHGKKSERCAAAAIVLSALLLSSASPAFAYSPDDGWVVISEPSYPSGIFHVGEKTAHVSDGPISVSSENIFTSLYSSNSTVAFDAGGDVRFLAVNRSDSTSVNGIFATDNSSLSILSDEGVYVRAEQLSDTDMYSTAALYATGGSSVRIEADRASFSTMSTSGAEAMNIVGDVSIISKGTTDQDGIFLDAAAGSNFIAALHLQEGKASLNSASNIRVTGGVLQSGTALDRYIGLLVHEDSALTMKAKDTISVNLDFLTEDGRSLVTANQGVGIYSSYYSGDTDYSVDAKANRIDVRVAGGNTNHAVSITGGGQVRLTADTSINLEAEGLFGQQHAVFAKQGGDYASRVDISAPTIRLSSSLTADNEVPESVLYRYTQNRAFALKTEYSSREPESASPEIRIGTDGAKLIEFRAEIDGVGNASGIYGDRVGNISIGTEDTSVIAIRVKASNNLAARNGYLPNSVGATQQQFDAQGIFFRGGDSTLDIKGKLLDVDVDGGHIRARGFRIDRGGELSVDAPLLMTVTSSFAPDMKYFEALGRKNDGLVIGMNESGLNTTATFNKPVTVIVTNDGNHSDNPNDNDSKGLATALFVEADCTVNFNADTLLMAGNAPQSGVLTAIHQLREAGDYDSLAALTGKIDKDLRDQFYKLNISQGIRIGDGANINFNKGESTIVAKTMFQKRNETHKGTGAINVASGAKLTLTTADIGAGIVKVADGGVLNTTSSLMNVTKAGAIENSGIVAAENFTITGGRVEQKAGLMTVNNLDISSGSLSVTGGTLSIARTLKNADGTVSLGSGSEVIISSDAVGITGENAFAGNPAHWTLPEGIGAISNSGGTITINVSDNKTKLTMNEYKVLRNRIFKQMLTKESTGTIRFGNYELSDFTYDQLKDPLLGWNPDTNPDEFVNQTIRDVDGGLFGSWQGLTLAVGKHEVKLDGDLRLSGSKPVLKADGTLGGVNTADKVFTSTGNAQLSHVTDGGSGLGQFVVEGHSSVGDISVGTLSVAAGGSISADTLSVGVATVDGNSSIGRFDSGILFADPAFGSDGRLSFADASRNIVQSVGRNATVEAGQGSLWAIGESASLDDAVSGLTRLGFANLSADRLKAAAYISTSSTYQGTLLITGRPDEEQSGRENFEGRAGTQQVYVAGHTALFIDASKNDGFTPLFAGDMTFADGSVLGLLNVSDDGFYVLLTDGTIIQEGEVAVLSDNSFVEPFISSNGVGTTIGARIDNAGLARAVSSTGIHAVARRADSRMAGLISDRAADSAVADEGLRLWVDAAGERYRSNKLTGMSKFRADLAYAAFGGDVEVTNGLRFGLAVGETTGSVRSESMKNSVDGVQASVYGTTELTDGLRAAADFTYTRTNNEVRSGGRTGINSDIDAKVYAVGFELQAPMTFGAFDLTPGIGLRISRIESEDFKVGAIRIEKDELNLVQVPLTLRVRTDAVEAGGWSFTPNAKIAFAPSFGDRAVSVRGTDQTVLDMSPLQADLGLTAVRGNFALGAVLTAGSGQHGSCSVGGSIRMNYTF